MRSVLVRIASRSLTGPIVHNTRETPRFFEYWGKAGKGDAVGCFHLLPYHALDVAAVGDVLLRRHLPWRDMLAARLGLSQAILLAWHRYFLALHDLGKFSYRFQALRCDLLRKLQDKATGDRYTQRHDSLGWLLWSEDLSSAIVDGAFSGSRPTDPGATASTPGSRPLPGTTANRRRTCTSGMF